MCYEREVRSLAGSLAALALPLPLPFFFELVRCFCELDLRGRPVAPPPPSLEYGESPPEPSPALDSAALDPETKRQQGVFGAPPARRRLGRFRRRLAAPSRRAAPAALFAAAASSPAG